MRMEHRPTADELLRHAGFLRALARSLLHDEQRADDVVQATYVAALKGAPAGRGALRAWLTGVARNIAKKVRRTEGRHAKRVRAAAYAGAAPSAAEVSANIEVSRMLTEAVDALDEPYRATVVLRFFYNLPPREVARTLEVPVETVRTRLRRALEQLRATLDGKYGDDRRAWSLALLPLATVRRTVSLKLAAAACVVLAALATVVVPRALRTTETLPRSANGDNRATVARDELDDIADPGPDADTPASARHYELRGTLDIPGAIAPGTARFAVTGVRKGRSSR